MTSKKERKPLAITIEEAGRLLGISRCLAYQLASEGKIPTVKMGKKRKLVPLAKLEQLIMN